MGTFCSVSLPVERQDLLADCTERAREIAEDVNDKLTVYTDTSEIVALNRQAGKGPVRVSDLTAEVLRLSREYAEQTDGCFDATVAPLVRAWGFNTGTVPAAVLDPTTVSNVLRRVGSQYITVDAGTAFLEQAGVEVDLGGIAKGYAVDLCYERLKDIAADGFMVNIGGNLRCAGTARPNRPWNVGVRNPFQRDAILGTLLMTHGMAIATSGNYERFVEIGGRRYAHILDPRTGFPVEGMAGVTVLCPSATRADALSTALFVAGIDGAVALLRKYPGVDALLVPDTQPVQILVTPGFAKQFNPLPEYAGAVQLLK